MNDSLPPLYQTPAFLTGQMNWTEQNRCKLYTHCKHSRFSHRELYTGNRWEEPLLLAITVNLEKIARHYICEYDEAVKTANFMGPSVFYFCIFWKFRPFVSLVSTVGKRAFPVSGATVWNDLPLHVASAPSLAVYRQRLKTFLFSISYQDTIIWVMC